MASRTGKDHPKVDRMVNDHGSSIMDDGSGIVGDWIAARERAPAEITGGGHGDADSRLDPSRGW
jgi:hypothetical protein